MKKKYITSFLFLFISLVFLPYINAQSNQEVMHYHNWFDASVGLENTGLYNGIEYEEKYRMINEKHKFFQTADFIEGSIIYDGQSYYTVMLKYDIHEDQVLIRLKNGFTEVTLQLIKEKISSFEIMNHRFTQITSQSLENKNISGFYENLFERPLFTLFKKHKSTKIKRLDRKVTYYEFFNDYQYILFYKNEYHAIKNRSDIIALFPELKKEIKTFYNTTRSGKKSNPDRFIRSIMQKVDMLLLNQNKGS